MLQWNWFNALYTLSIVFVLVNFSWKYLSIPIGAVLLIFSQRVQFILDSLIWVIPYYVVTSFAVIIVFGIKLNMGHSSVFISIICGVFLSFSFLFGIVQHQSELEKQGYESFNFMVLVRYVFLILSIAFYVYSLYKPEFAITEFILWIAKIIQWVRSVPILGWLVGVFSFFYAIYIVIVALISALALISSSTKNLISKSQ